MRKLLVFLLIITLLASACYSNPPADPVEPGKPGPGPEEPVGPQPDPGGNEEDPPEPDLPQAQIIWQKDSLPGYYQDIHAGDFLLYLAEGTISGQHLEDGSTLWVRDLARDGFALWDIYLDDTLLLLRGGTLTYPMTKDGKIYIEQLDIATGSELWRLEVGKEGEDYFDWEGDLVKVVSGYHPEEIMYYSLSSGRPIPFLKNYTAYLHRGFYYTFSQGKPYTMAKFTSDGQRLWQAVIDAEMSYPYFGEIWSRDDTLFLSLADYTEARIQQLTIAVNDLDGSILWTRHGFRADILGDSVIIIDSDKTVVVEMSTGHERHVLAHNPAGELNTFVWKGSLYVAGRSSLQKFDLVSGEELWRKTMPGRIDLYYGVNPEDNLWDMEIIWALLEVTSEGRDYLDEELLAIDPETGTLLASYPFTVPHGGLELWPIRLTRDSQGNNYIVLEKNAHLGLWERSVQLIDAQTGKKLWEYQYPEDYTEVDVFFSESDNLVVMLRNFSQEVEVLYLEKGSGQRVHHFRAEGYPSRMIGDRIVMEMSSNQTALIAPPE